MDSDGPIHLEAEATESNIFRLCDFFHISFLSDML